MNNPFETIQNDLSTIKNLLLDIKNKPEPTENKMLSVKELSDYAGTSELTIRNWIKEGKVKAKQIGRRILIDKSQFEDGLTEVKSLKYKR